MAHTLVLRREIVVPAPWSTLIETWNPPHGFSDVQLRGPYARWDHRHSFAVAPDGAGTVVRDEVPVHDLHATMLHLLGFDHERLTVRFQGRDHRLTDVHGHVVKDILA